MLTAIDTVTPALNQEHVSLTSPEPLTYLFRKAVPLLEAFGFRIEHVGDGESICSLPFSAIGGNQNQTLQASTFYILADYAVGTAMFGALPGYRIFGMQKSESAIPVQGWLKDGYVKHIRPATGAIRSHVTISDEDKTRIRQELSENGKATYAGEVRILQGDVLVALAKHTVVLFVVKES